MLSCHELISSSEVTCSWFLLYKVDESSGSHPPRIDKVFDTGCPTLHLVMGFARIFCDVARTHVRWKPFSSLRKGGPSAISIQGTFVVPRYHHFSIPLALFVKYPVGYGGPCMLHVHFFLEQKNLLPLVRPTARYLPQGSATDENSLWDASSNVAAVIASPWAVPLLFLAVSHGAEQEVARPWLMFFHILRTLHGTPTQQQLSHCVCPAPLCWSHP